LVADRFVFLKGMGLQSLPAIEIYFLHSVSVITFEVCDGRIVIESLETSFASFEQKFLRHRDK
jgi:hypothetical protein